MDSLKKTRYYFDTSIWLDFFENRDEPNFPKGSRIKMLIKRITKNDGKLIISEAVINEMLAIGYSIYEIKELFLPLRKRLIRIYSTKKQFGKAKDLSQKRSIPVFDALHALIARDNKAMMITRDEHFNKLLDITKPKKPEELI